MKLIKGVNVGEVILVASGKGGTGKSMVTVNLGTVLSRKGYRVVLVDMDNYKRKTIDPVCFYNWN